MPVYSQFYYALITPFNCGNSEIQNVFDNNYKNLTGTLISILHCCLEIGKACMYTSWET